MHCLPALAGPARTAAQALCLALCLSGPGQEVRAAPPDTTRIAAPAPSQLVGFRIGDVLHGPGVVTVGGFGARKQLVVPAGDWVVLAAVDHDSKHRVAVRLTSVVLGRFDGRQLRSSFFAMFVSRPAPVGHTWKEMADCEKGNPAARFKTRGQTANVGHCLQLLAVKPRPMASWSGTWTAVRDNLQQLEAWRDEGLGLVTEMVLTDNRGGFLRVVRFDHGQQQQLSGRHAAGHIEQRADWANSYVELAGEGLGAHLSVPDLQPGRRDARSQLALPE